jgi:DNA polymerase-2
MKRTVAGWLFDVYPDAQGVTLWLIGESGEKVRCHAPFLPSFYLHLHDQDERRAVALGAQSPVALSFAHASQRELFSDEVLRVLKVSVRDPTRFRQAVGFYEKFFPHFAFYNSDILPSQLFLYETGLFVLARGLYEIDEGGVLTSWELRDSRESCEYAIPPMTMMMLKSANDHVPPKYQRTLQLEITYEGKTYALESADPAEVIDSLNWHLHHGDPDILLTEYGDATLLPTLARLAAERGMPLFFNRDAGREYKVSRESSFFQYGKVVHKDGAFELRGRWHIDAKNSFTLAESDLEGLYELVRVTQLCPQHQARASIGTGLSSLQLSWAYANGVLIPSKKREPEEFKPASTLLLADRGGLMYFPPVGFHQEIAELDFVSMYPSIMVNHNVSPETVNCRCCQNHAVPELGYTICERREGIVPATLRSIVRKRAYYKEKRNEVKGKDEHLYRRYEGRQSSLKWMLVSCFGYLGYKNARFGRIEAHESVNAFSREAILRAKEAAEEQGFELVHAIIDCVWLRKPGMTRDDLQGLCREIRARVGIDLSLEGIYRWILFPSSKVDPVMPTGTRYVGAYTHGETKIRGIEARRRDTPRFVKKMQNELLGLMAPAPTVEAIRETLPALLEVVRRYLTALATGSVNPMELVLRRNITKEADEYMNNSISATVTKLIAETGIHLAAGEAIEYIIIDASGKRQAVKAKPLALYAFEDGYDIEKYSAMVLDAASTLLSPFGLTAETLAAELLPKAPKPPPPKPRPKARKNARDTSMVLDLFAGP